MPDPLTCTLDDTHTMKCMEVWGGNQLVDSGVVMAGLDAWVYSRPFGDASAGGDVYYVSSCATGRITRLLVADVTGHGSAVHAVAVQLRQLMRRFVNYIDQTRFMQTMNEQFALLSRNGSFATAVVTTFFAPTNRLRLCNAGHPPPLIFRSASRQWTYLDQHQTSTEPENLPLGVLDLGKYQQFDERLKVGDLVFCYTDSLPESADAAGHMLGQAGLLQVVRGLEVGDPATFVPRLLDQIAALRKGNLLNDDVTALLFRPNGMAPNTPVLQSLLAPFRVLKSLIQSVRRKERVGWPKLSVANIGGAVVPSLNRADNRKHG